MTRSAASMLLVCSGLAACQSVPGNATVALIGHFDQPPGEHLLGWITPVIREVFRPAGLSLKWFGTRDAAPPNVARTVDVWFYGDCRSVEVHDKWRPSAEPVHLGWVYSYHGNIGDAIFIDCTAIQRLAAQAGDPVRNRALVEVVFLRLLERVTSHELLHVLLMTAGHGVSDCRQPSMRPSDWARVGRLTTAEVQWLRQLYEQEHAPPVWALFR